MSDLPSRRCHGTTCRQQVLLAPTVNGKTMPLDTTPTPHGNVALDRDLFGDPVVIVLTGDHLATARTTGRQLFMPHHASCPDVEEFRHA